ncbi:MAG: OmpA family protein [Proteobacteria bacterium]|nr:OmpA family protein [Pseudomonadota bacterium]
MKLSPRPVEDEDELSAFWLITYSDMTTLLLTFFLLIYAFTMLGEDSQKTLLDSLNVVSTGDEAVLDKASAQELESAARKIAGMLGEDGDGAPWVNIAETEVTVGLPASITFNSGKADLTPRAKGYLRKAAAVLINAKCPVRVEGHTDNVPTGRGMFKSNWHLSVARAQEVARLLMEEGLEPRYLQVVGYADTNPMKSNDTYDSRATNRRIEIKLIRMNHQSGK